MYEDSNIQVEAFSVNHGSWPTFGYKFISADRTVVISGDTAPTEGLIEHYKGCDVLIHEVYSVSGFDHRPADWQKYHSTVHTSSYELAKMAAIVEPDLLILYHQLHWGTTDDALIREIQKLYTGKIVSGKDLEVY